MADDMGGGGPTPLNTGTTRTFGNMLNEKTRLNLPKKKPMKMSGWEKK